MNPSLKRLHVVLVLAVVLFSAIAGAQFVNLAAANFFPEPTPSGIRINSDGTVEGTDNIHRSDNVYTLTGDIYRTIVVLRDGIVLDGAGYTLQGNGDGTGVFLQERNGVTIKNLKICNFDYGIKFTWLSYGSPTSPRSNKVSGNTITNNTCGIAFYDFSSGDEVSDNYIADNTYGVVSASGVVFRNNRFRNNDGAISESIYVVNDIDTSNTVNGKPIYYWVGQHDRTVPSDAGWVVLKNCSGIMVQGLSLECNADGVLLCYTTDSTVSGNVIANNLNGITLEGSSNNVISDNQVRNNKGYGIRLEYGSGSNIISRNEVVGNTKDGVYFESSVNNAVTENRVMENNGNGVFFKNIQDSNVIENNITLNRGCGIGFGYGPNGTIRGNYISRNEKGIWISNAFENTITLNTIAENNGWGIELEGSHKNNVIHHNNFINNSLTEELQVRIAGVWTYPGLGKPLFPGEEREPPKLVDGAANVWDDGKEGNYWIDYNGTDANGNGIGDIPYIINENNQDNYPLMNPIVIPETPIAPAENLTPSQPLIAMPEEYINYTICRVNGSLWAKVDGTYPLHKIFGAGDLFELDGVEYAVLSDELPLVYPTPPGATNISVKMNKTELNWSNYTENHPEALHHTAIGDWPMIYCTIYPVPDYFILKIHYEHPIIMVNGSYTFLYDLNISPYLSPWCTKSTAYFNIRMETNCANLHTYTVGSNGAWNPINYTITKENTAEIITIKIISEYHKPLPGDLVVTFTEAKQSGSLGTGLSMKIAVTIVVVAIAGYLFLKRRKSAMPTETNIAALKG